MLRSLARVTAMLAALAVAGTAHAAEEKAAAPASRVSVGVSLSALDFGGVTADAPVSAPADVYVGFDLGQFRLEPSLGINYYTLDAGPKARSFNLGLGALFPLKSSKTVSVYVGPRLFLNFVSAKDQLGNAWYSDSGVDFTLAGVLGAEWFADPRFSIGAEARLGLALGSELSNGGAVLRPASTRFYTSGLLFLRFYL
jgi:hypothetical protein